MNKIFENEYIMNKKFINEYVYNILCKKLVICGFIISILGFLTSIFISDEKLNIILILSIISLIITVCYPIMFAKELEKNSKILNNGKIEKTHIKFSDKIYMNEGANHLEFEYKQIKQIINAKNFIVLKISKSSAILVFKEGFSRGKEIDFIEFIERKTK